MADITPGFIKEVFDASRVLVDKSTLEGSFDTLAKKISTEQKKENPIAVCVMNGGLFITSEIVKRLLFPLQVDYIHASRYRNEYTGSQTLNWVKTPNIDPKGRTVVLFDDVLDGGLTLAEVKRYYEDRGALKVLTAVMLDKKAPREKGGLAVADYAGLEIENEFVFGFGLDYHGYLRNCPEIRAVAKKHMI
ncbi:MAG: hypoxanthine-guanine phosphoribosyltransferase [Francisellaceae bacterium]